MDTDASSDLFLDMLDEAEDALENEDIDIGRELLVYMIDASRHMFLPFGKEVADGATETYFSAVVKAVAKDMKTRIISRERDEVAICFFNTREKKNFQESDGVFVFQASDQEKISQDEPSPPTARLIKDFSDIIGVFNKDIGSAGGISGSHENPLYNALWVAQGLLRKGSVKNSSKRILLFTNNDDPFADVSPASRKDLRRITIQRARDAQDLGISIDIFPFSKPGEDFNILSFYADMLDLSEEERTNFVAIAGERFDDMASQMRKKVFKKRAVCRLMLTISNGMQIGVQTFALFRTAVPAASAWLDSFDNKLLKSERSFICSDTGALLSEPLKHFQEYKSKKVCFSPIELSEVKKITNVQLQLLGFKPLELLQDYYNLRPATFLYPDEERVSGSTCAFIALYRAMLRSKKYGVAFLGGTCRMVALVPQEEIVNEVGQVEPPGFNMIYLPFSDDIRHVEKLHGSSDGHVPRASNDQIEKAMAMLKKVDLGDFSYEHYSNPALQRHYAILEAFALQEDELPGPRDDTMPPEEQMQRPAIMQVVKEFKESVYGADDDLEEEAAAVEKAPRASSASQKRKAAEEAASQDFEKYNWDKLADTGKLKELTVSELKVYLLKHSLPVTGKKEVIINRILTHLGK